MQKERTGAESSSPPGPPQHADGFHKDLIFCSKSYIFWWCQVSFRIQMSCWESPTLQHRCLWMGARGKVVSAAVPASCSNPYAFSQPLASAQAFLHSTWPGGTSRSPVLPYLCVFSWALHAAGSEKALLHSLQEKGFSPVWIRMCRLKLPVWVNSFPQS